MIDRARSIVGILITSLLCGNYTFSVCPDCISDLASLQPNQQWGTTADGRTKVKLCVSAASPDNASKVAQAVQDAITLWNVARGTNDQPSPYFFEFSEEIGECDLKVGELPNLVGGCASLDVDDPSAPIKTPTQIWIDPRASNKMVPDDLAGLVAHEMAHAQKVNGLPEGEDPLGICPAEALLAPGFSIMTAAFYGCTGLFTKQVRPRDFDATTQSGCAYTWTNHLNQTESNMCEDACESPDCSNFDEVACANQEIQDEYCEEVSSCWDRWLITDYYWCDSNGCTYLYSEWELLGTYCQTFNPCT